MSKIKVSVIVAIYNVEPYIKRSLLSLVHQTLKDIEIICVDDKGTDASFQIVEEFAKKDKRFKLIYNKRNLGRAYSAQKGLEKAKGEYITFVDPDDWIDLNFLEKLYFAAKQNNCDIAKADRVLAYADQTTDPVQMNKLITSRLSKGLSLFSSWTFGWTTAIYKNKFIKKNKIHFSPLNVGFDVLFLTEILAKHPKVVIINGVFYYYLQRTSSVTKKIDAYNTQTWLLNILKILMVASQVPMKKDEFLSFFSTKINIFMRHLNEYEELNGDSKIYQNLLAVVLTRIPDFKKMYKFWPDRIQEWNKVQTFMETNYPKDVQEKIQNIIDNQIHAINIKENKNV